ncbi:MAG: hypothetical protein K2F97_09800, partial [Muribaculaceae bacterium]|nr:hypothetical protein [Muribaculaceae bacterium]
MKKLLLTLLLLLSLGFAASAAQAELTIVNNAFVGSDDISVTIAKANGGTAPNWGTAGQVRVYAKNTINVKGATGVTITNVVFSTASTNGTFLNGASADKGTFDAAAKTWTGSEQEFTITNSNLSGGHTRVTGMTVTYTKETLTECPAPVFSVEDGDEVFQGQMITVNKKDATSVQLYVNNVEVEGESYIVPTDAAFGSTITLTAISTLEGEGVTVPTNTTTITVTVAEKQVYTLLTDVADLYDGARGYIVCTANNEKMGSQKSGNYRNK